MPAPLRAGEMRHSITIQRYTSTQDSLGALVLTWATLCTARAMVEALGGTGRLETIPKQDLATVTYRIRIRFRSDVTPAPKDRVLFGTKYLNIESVTDPSGRRREYVLMCTEILG
jgi:SPP1 family predicted phage head-tail adaptor